ncbi:hypothetical protein FEK35_11850 [Nocardia cyriacigeorgica]|uniref:Uncharacterized protein n=1 Tax=Nocardia cyriacigeorgica TaxID=135487 RepID=A0A5R8PFW8_9NOCA|nr:hypothetical protein [Nocardia cyriacigeorgica]TLG12192.1 hypothetical protein FEK35_11850 [Nocardia cyriacigeorgica]
MSAQLPPRGVVLTWAVSGAMPLPMLIVVLADPVSGLSDRIRTGIYVRRDTRGNSPARGLPTGVDASCGPCDNT